MGKIKKSIKKLSIFDHCGKYEIMNPLEIQKTKSTPYVFIDCETAEIKMKGVCLPENSIGFFEKIYVHIDCIQNQEKTPSIEMNIEYINSGSQKAFVDLFMKIKTFNTKNFEVKWTVEEDDEELMETIEAIHSISGLAYKIIFV